MISYELDLKSDSQDIVKKLTMLDRKVQRLVILKVLRATAAPVRKTMRNNSPVDTGKMKKSIKLEKAKTKRGKGERYLVGPQRKKGDKDRNSFYAAFLEYGVRNKDGSWRIQPTKFMTRSVEQSGPQAIAAAKKSWAIELEKEIKNLPKVQLRLF
jgi:HK97 gp10 family phage protein